jgi:DNA-directed RNA polymerase specialized sigma24 family protein
MGPLLQHEICQLLACSSSKVHLSYKEALEKMKEYPEYEDLIDIFTD